MCNKKAFMQIIRVYVFLLLGAVLLFGVNKVVTNPAGDYRMRQFFDSFYAEDDDTLDAVFIGSSGAYAFWLPTLAWDRYGIAVHLLSSNAQPFEAAEFLIREGRKSQKDAVYIVLINNAYGEDEMYDARIHYLTDYMPFSWNKVQMVRTLGGYMGQSFSEQMEYLFPLIRYHSRWNELQRDDFAYSPNGLKATNYINSFLRNSSDISSSYRITELTAALSDSVQSALDSLLAYCDEEQVKVLFVQTPRAVTNEFSLAQVNMVKEEVLARGYPVLDMLPVAEDLELDLAQDYYNENHTNIHGAIKVTDYLSQYLIENYGLEDKRSDPAYESWNNAHDRYTLEYAAAYTLDVEWAGEPRDNALAAPKLSTISAEGSSLTISWNAVLGADGYRVYRKLRTTLAPENTPPEELRNCA